MVTETIAWIEGHQATVGLLTSVGLVVVAWAAGAFSFLWRYRRKPILEVPATAGFVYIERPHEPAAPKEAMRASFIIHAVLVNASNEKVVLDRFELSFRSIGFWRSNRQRLLRFAFPARPRKRLGKGHKYMPVWFTDYPEDGVGTPGIGGSLEPKELAAGYLLFSSYTYGNWNPKIKDGSVTVRLSAKLTSQQWLRTSCTLRVIDDPELAQEFSPGLVAHVAHESTWNHDLSIRKR